jgi:hypothetical protein
MRNMSYAELKALHFKATATRDMTHKAYEDALKNWKITGESTDNAFQALLLANQVRNDIYKALIGFH